ncbi:MAG: Sec-independent protein translocase protein TatB [Motiliproteus sp.]
MFDIGFTEILIVGVVALIVLGPERLPSALRTAGMWLGRIKQTVGTVQKEISEELRVEEMRQAAKKQQEELEQSVETLKKPFNESLREEMLTTSPVADQQAEPAETTADTAASPNKPSAE